MKVDGTVYVRQCKMKSTLHVYTAPTNRRDGERSQHGGSEKDKRLLGIAWAMRAEDIKGPFDPGSHLEKGIESSASIDRVKGT